MDTIFATISEYSSTFNSFTIALRLVLALIMGGLIGMERGRHGRAAGMRTHILVCLGACMTALVGLFMQPTGDATRIAAQVISGIGFLGAGTIMIRNQSVITGLTTAAGVWCTATIGIALGYGFYWGATVATVIALITATLLTRLETGKKVILRFYLELEKANQVTATIQEIKKRYPTMKHPEISAPKSGLSHAVGLSVTLVLDRNEQEICQSELAAMDNVLFAVEE